MTKTYFYIVLAALLFGTMEVALKLAGSTLDSFQLTFLRFMIGGLVLLPFALREIKLNQVKLKLKDFAYLLYVGILGIPLSMLFFQMGVMHSNASTASVLICINPFFTMIFAHFMTEEKLKKSSAAVLILGLLGIIFMIKPWNLQEGNTVKGVTFMIVAAIFFGLYTVAGKISVKKMGIMAQTSISFILGSLVLLIIMLFMGKPVVAGVIDQWLIVAYVSIFVTGMGYYAYFMGIKLSDATTGSITFFLKPVIAPFFAVIFLSEIILWNTYIGMAFILVASLINIKQKRKEERLNEQTPINQN